MSLRPLEVQLLGDFKIRIGERIIPNDAWKLRKAAGIVKLLALEPTHRLHREQVLDTFWPDLDPASAANNLRYALHSARKTLAADSILYREGHHLVLADPPDIDVDVHTFESAADAAWRGISPADFRRATHIYRGDLLPSDLYEEWLDARRTALRTSYLALLARLARILEEQGDTDGAIEVWHQVVSSDPLHEEAHSRLMLVFAQAGRRDDALERYRMLVTNLERALGVEPDPVTIQLAEAIRNGTLGETRAPLESRSRPSNLPAPMTTLVGRQRDIAEARQALGESRLVTLTGPGGVGKTQLAITAARDAVQNHPDGVFLVQLAPLSKPELVVTTIIRTLDIFESSSETPEETLIEFLSGRSMLLVLDNFEHVLPAAMLVSRMLQAAPGLTILTTSRALLHLRGERVYHVRALSEEASSSLFVERSQEVNPAFAPDDREMDAIRQICQRLDALPLAIELAAARSNILSPTALLDRLDKPLALLTGGPRDLPDRQQTLRTAIGWSYELLPYKEQILFQKLAVFQGGWTLQAAEHVSAEDQDVLSRISALVDSNLIEALPQDDLELRFRMLETIREYGLERLSDSGGEEAARMAHARFFADLVASAPPYLLGPDHAHWLIRLELEHANIRAALDWLAERDVEAGLWMLTGLWRFWWMRAHLTIGRAYFERFLEMIDDTFEPALVAQVLTGAGVMAEFSSDFAWDRAEALHQQALSIWLDLSDPPYGAYWSYLCLGNLAVRTGDFTKARAFYDEGLIYPEQHGQAFARAGALLLIGNLLSSQGAYDLAEQRFRESHSLAREGGDPWLVSMSTNNIGVLLQAQGRYAESQPYFAEALHVGRQLGNHRDTALALGNLGWVNFYQDHIQEATTLFEESLDLANRSNDKRSIAFCMCGLATCLLHNGEIDQALGLFRQSFANFRASGELIGLPDALEGIADAYARRGEPERATAMFSAAAAYREQSGIAAHDVFRKAVEAAITSIRDTLDDTRFQTAWEQGSTLTIDQIWNMETSRAEAAIG